MIGAVNREVAAGRPPLFVNSKQHCAGGSVDWLTKMGSVIERVRTPLALAGLVVVVLYGLYKQILGSDILTKVGQDQTFVLLDRILFYLFILAVTAVLLGAVGYLFSIRSAKSKH
jgi:hypothetical protein